MIKRWLALSAGVALWVVGAAGIGYAASFMSDASDTPEPELVAFGVTLISVLATFPWMTGTLLVLWFLPFEGRRWIAFGALSLPWLVWLGLAVPVLRAVCARPGGSCG